MSADTDFDKALEPLELTYAQVELIKQAVDEFVIVPQEKNEYWPVWKKELTKRQRQALWGDKS